MKLFVIADDFTGANDTGVQLAKKGAQVEVLFDWQNIRHSNHDVIVVNLESRAIPPAQAQQRVKVCLSGIKSGTLIFKKIDSTLRGNVGVEIDAVLSAVNAKLAIVVAAIPSAGRVTLGGCCYVNGTPLLETEFASDPKTPIYSSSIKEIIASQTNIPVHVLPRSEINVQRLQQMTGIVILDAENEQDLQNITQVVSQLSQSYILVGAAGLANALPTSLFIAKKRPLPALVIAGSMSNVTRQQVLFAVQDDVADVIEINVAHLLDKKVVQAYVTKAIECLHSKRHCILSTCKAPDERLRIDDLCHQYQVDRNQLSEIICQTLAEITRKVLLKSQVGGLVLTGGDVAIAVATNLKASGYRILHEVAPCIPCGNLLDSEIDDLPVITKAGGFGSQTALRDSLYFIEELYSEH